jgi:hypothetical protein
LSIISFVLSFQLKARWPLRLGGTPRKGVFYSANIDQESLQKVADLVEAGKLKGLVDSEWAMEDAVKVRRILDAIAFHAYWCVGV